MSETAELSFPLSRSCPLTPPPDYARLRAEQPVTRVRTFDGSAWLVTRHADVRAVLGDPRFSSDRRNPGFPRLAPGQGTLADNLGPVLIGMDPPQHTAARRAVVGEFTMTDRKSVV